MKAVTTTEAGLKKDEVYSLVFNAAIDKDGPLEMAEIYEILNRELKKKDLTLSEQGRASLRRLINTNAVNDGFIFPHSETNPGWRITREAKELVAAQGSQKELVFNQETGTDEVFVPNTVRGALFEKYCLGLLKVIYPRYSWFHQGKQKINERGLDLIAERLGDIRNEYSLIGVQIKNHQEMSSPNGSEWLKFMAGCFVRHVDKAIFITTGRLTSEQRREAGEAKIVVIEGKEELHRIAAEYKHEEYTE